MRQASESSSLQKKVLVFKPSLPGENTKVNNVLAHEMDLVSHRHVQDKPLISLGQDNVFKARAIGQVQICLPCKKLER
jgi:hypothetical protein